MKVPSQTNEGTQEKIPVILGNGNAAGCNGKRSAGCKEKKKTGSERLPEWYEESSRVVRYGHPGDAHD